MLGPASGEAALLNVRLAALWPSLDSARRLCVISDGIARDLEEVVRLIRFRFWLSTLSRLHPPSQRVG